MVPPAARCLHRDAPGRGPRHLGHPARLRTRYAYPHAHSSHANGIVRLPGRRPGHDGGPRDPARRRHGVRSVGRQPGRDSLCRQLCHLGPQPDARARAPRASSEGVTKASIGRSNAAGQRRSRLSRPAPRRVALESYATVPRSTSAVASGMSAVIARSPASILAMYPSRYCMTRGRDSSRSRRSSEGDTGDSTVVRSVRLRSSPPPHATRTGTRSIARRPLGRTSP